MLSPMLDCHQQGDEGSDRTMILLYGAGGGPGRGGRPMDSIRSRASDDFPLRVYDEVMQTHREAWLFLRPGHKKKYQ